MGEIDAAGDLVTGTLMGRAVERDSRAGEDHGPGICLNCGAELVGPHCHRCGQVGHVHRTIGAIWHEILHGVVHFEGKLWNTLPLLTFRPGELTRRYIFGERAHFVSPMAMFLFSVFTMFAAMQIMGVSPPTDLGSSAQFEQTINYARTNTAEALADARESRAKAEPGSERAQRLDQRIEKLSADLADLQRIPMSLGERAGYAPRFKTGWKRLDEGIEKAEKNPGLALYKLQTNSYKFSWALIPLSIPFVWALFAWRPRFRGYDHAVFVTYSLAFMSLLFIALLIGSALGLASGVVSTLATFVPPVHIFFQLKGAYRLRWWSALLRTFVLLFFITFIVTLFALLLLGLGLLG
ncbi:DUF3667 domain-containing protein [Sphingomonas suaedae]|uniref:DUF3667 domain-containing protein n=1 Tax=Sphingomonas suaedae TaxID=2599297 RepID=A0A518RJL3_9SPHN|nr:DUF3667 domain-containing protein [Sphingomonas suaedae]QDX27619.1 DUF3667 domain-containing protein [Sphingomonas suaedae]